MGKTLRKFYGENEQCWYIDRKGLIKRFIENKIIWLGGWDTPFWEGATYFSKFNINRSNWISPAPITLFGCLDINFFGFTFKIKKHYYCWHWDGRFINIIKFNTHRIYRSLYANPQSADVWYKGWPQEVLESVKRPEECGGNKNVS